MSDKPLEPVSKIEQIFTRPRTHTYYTLSEHVITALQISIEKEIRESNTSGIWRTIFIAAIGFFTTSLKFYDGSDGWKKQFAMALLGGAIVAALISGFMMWKEYVSPGARTQRIAQWLSEQIKPK